LFQQAPGKRDRKVEKSERFLGSWLEQRGCQPPIVLFTGAGKFEARRDDHRTASCDGTK